MFRTSSHAAFATAIALCAFAGNSLLCRIAFKNTAIDPASFTTLRLVSGAAALWLMTRKRASPQGLDGNWTSALALFTYAACFSFAYVGLPAATGALLLFSAVQATMIGYGAWTGEGLGPQQGLGLLLSLGGLLILFGPGLEAPSPIHSVMMVVAGMAWGAYSLRGRRSTSPLRTTAGNFLRTVPMTVTLSAVFLHRWSWDTRGAAYALAAGIISSAIGYAIWYRALPDLRPATAASTQLSVPVIAAAGAVLFLAEPVTPRLALAAVAVLGGIALVILRRS